MAKGGVRGLNNLFNNFNDNITEEDFYITNNVEKKIKEKEISEKTKKIDNVIEEKKVASTLDKELKNNIKKQNVPKKVTKKKNSEKNINNQIIRTMVDDNFKVAVCEYCIENEINENNLVLECINKILSRNSISKEKIKDKLPNKTKSVYCRCSNELKKEFTTFCKSNYRSVGYVLSQEIANVIGYSK